MLEELEEWEEWELNIKLQWRLKSQEKYLPQLCYPWLPKEHISIIISEQMLIVLLMDLNQPLFRETLLLLINLENKPTPFFGILFILLSVTAINATYLKWTTMNFVWEFKIAISVPPIFTVVGARLLEDACPEIKNMLSVLLHALMDGFSTPNPVMVK